MACTNNGLVVDVCQRRSAAEDSCALLDVERREGREEQSGRLADSLRNVCPPRMTLTVHTGDKTKGGGSRSWFALEGTIRRVSAEKIRIGWHWILWEWLWEWERRGDGALAPGALSDLSHYPTL